MSQPMTDELRFPFQLRNAFFKSLEFYRDSNLPKQFEFPITVSINVHADDFPARVQVNVKLETPDDGPLKLCVELIGLFVLVENHPAPDESILPDFINERALHMLWPYLYQAVRQITAMMGTNPVDIKIPYAFEFQPQEESELIDAQ
jgi:preprotein translocase subunit SecB